MPELATEYSNTVLNEDGSYTAKIAAGPVNYQAESGAWLPISNDLVEAPGAAYAVENEANDYTVSIPENPAVTPVRFETEDAWVTMKLAGSDDVEPGVDGDEASFEDLVPAADEVVYRATDTGVKESITLDTPPTAAVSYSYVLSTPEGVTPHLTGNGVVEFRNAQDALVLLIPAGHMLDSTPAEEGYSNDVDYQLTQTSSGWKLTMTPDLGWLQDPARVYPVIIDPTVTAPDKNPQKDCWLQQSAPGTNRCNADYIWAGVFSGSLRRGLLDFGVDFIPAGSTVTNAELWLGINSAVAVGNGGAAVFNLYTPYSRWSDKATWNGAGDGIGAWNGGSPTFLQSSGPNLGGNSNGWVGWNVTQTVKNWRSGSELNHGFLIKQQSESVDRGVGFYGNSGPNTVGRPILRVTYTVSDTPFTPSQVSASPGGPGYTTSASPTLSAVVSDPNGDVILPAYQIFNQGTMIWSSWGAVTTPSGGTATIGVPAGVLVVDEDYDLDVYAWDGVTLSTPKRYTFEVAPHYNDAQQGKANARTQSGETVSLATLPISTLKVKSATPDQGPLADVASVKAALPKLLEMDTDVGAMPEASLAARQQGVAARTNSSGGESVVASRVQDVWAAGAASTESQDWVVGLQTAASDATYRPYTDSDFAVASWQGVQVQGSTATATLMGHRTFLDGAGWAPDADGQFQITLTRAASGDGVSGWELQTVQVIPADDLTSGTAVGTGAVLNSASSFTYSGSSAATYAKKYACNGANCSNPAFDRYENDCANFVSQALAAGGMPIRNSGSVTWAPGSAAWVNVSQWLFFMDSIAHRIDHGVKPSMGAAYTPASKGDVYLYDWGEGNGYSHLSIATRWGDFTNYYDSTKNRNYNQVTGGHGDKIAQHTTDRDGAPWNWGYQTQRDPKIRAKMRTVLLEMNTSGDY